MYRFSKEILLQSVQKSLYKRPKAKILLVEDDALNQRIFTAMLNLLGYKVSIAKNGAEALAMYQDGYEAILLDYELPDMTGLEICKSIRKNETQSDTYIPIVIASCCAEDGMQSKCLAMGADKFVAKPILIDDLKRLLQTLFFTR